MNPPPSALRIVAFADPGTRLWGAAVDAGEAAIVFGSDVHTGAAGDGHTVALETRGDAWVLSGDSFELTVTPVDGAWANLGEELCRVRGTVALGGERVSLECPGTRTEDDVVVDELDSLRGVWGWFEDHHTLGVRALRPRGRNGQENDRMKASVFDPDGVTDVDEPRLSTTYTQQGLPSRTSLELWISEGEEQYPVRAAAEALGTGAGVSAAGLALQVSPMRCHSRGLDGPGVYLLARF